MNSIKHISLLALASCLTCLSAHAMFHRGPEEPQNSAGRPSRHTPQPLYQPAGAQAPRQQMDVTSMASASSVVSLPPLRGPVDNVSRASTASVPPREMGSPYFSPVPLHLRTPHHPQQAPQDWDRSSVISGRHSVSSAMSHLPSARQPLVLTPAMLRALDARNARHVAPLEFSAHDKRATILIDHIEALNHGIEAQVAILREIDPIFINYLNGDDFATAHAAILPHLSQEIQSANAGLFSELARRAEEEVTAANLNEHLGLYNAFANLMNAHVTTLHEDAQESWICIQSFMENTNAMIDRAEAELQRLHPQLTGLEAELIALFDEARAAEDARSVSGHSRASVASQPFHPLPVLRPQDASQLTLGDFYDPHNLDAASMYGGDAPAHGHTNAQEPDAATARLIQQLLAEEEDSLLAQALEGDEQ